MISSANRLLGVREVVHQRSEARLLAECHVAVTVRCGDTRDVSGAEQQREKQGNGMTFQYSSWAVPPNPSKPF